jgi:hypothetical protein
MRRALPLAATALALLVAPAGLAAVPTNAQLAAQLKALRAKVTKQDRTIRTLQAAVNEARGLAAGGLAFSACGFAITSDALQGTFGVVDQLSVNTPNVARAIFGPQTPISDAGACTALQVVRAQTVPPTTATFSALLSLLRAPSALDVPRLTMG